MIFGKTEEEIVSLAVQHQSAMTDGVVQYNYETGELFGAGFTTGTVENPANPFIEVYRLPQGERGEIDCKCHENGDCPYWVDDEYGGHFDEDKVIEYSDNYSETRVDCCIDGMLNDYDLEDEIREDLESQIRDVINEVVSDDLSKFNDIRIAISDKVGDAYDYVQVRTNDTYEMDTLDYLVDGALDGEFIIKTSEEFLEGEIIYFAQKCEYAEEDVEFWSKVQEKIEDFDLDGALELLQ